MELKSPLEEVTEFIRDRTTVKVSDLFNEFSWGYSTEELSDMVIELEKDDKVRLVQNRTIIIWKGGNYGKN